MSNLYALILAGGSGTRLWPLSRQKRPKQLLPLVGDRSIYRITVERLYPLVPPERVFVVSNNTMTHLIQEQEPIIPAQNYVVEPSPKDSGPAAALGIAHIAQQDPGATIAILSADHYIGLIDEFQQTLEAAHQVAAKDYIVTLGITPSHPSTGFGYIERGESLGVFENHNVYRTVRFAEKPALHTAQQWLAGGAHFWNAGMFVMTCATAWREYERQQPAFAASLHETSQAIGKPQYANSLARTWDIAPRKSIDYAIMEGAEFLALIPVDMQWSDIGTWASLFDVIPTDANGNVIIGDHIGIDTHNTLVHGNQRLIATIGLDNLVVVDTPDALLICPRNRVQDVKTMVERLRAQKRDEVL